jgi:hypothetical protein
VAIVFKDLQKLVSHSQQQNSRKELFQRLHDKPFWIWNVDKHRRADFRTDGDCCFNHIIGLPTKEGIEKAMFDYEKLLYDSIFSVNGISNYSFNSILRNFKRSIFKKKPKYSSATEAWRADDI